MSCLSLKHDGEIIGCPNVDVVPKTTIRNINKDCLAFILECKMVHYNKDMTFDIRKKKKSVQ